MRTSEQILAASQTMAIGSIAELATGLPISIGMTHSPSLKKLCLILGIAEADLLLPLEGPLVVSDASQQIIQQIDDPELRECTARLLWLQEQRDRPART